MAIVAAGSGELIERTGKCVSQKTVECWIHVGLGQGPRSLRAQTASLAFARPYHGAGAGEWGGG